MKAGRSIADRVKASLARNPNKNAYDVAKSLGLRVGDVKPHMPDIGIEAGSAPASPAMKVIALSEVREKLDIAARIRKCLKTLKNGSLMAEPEFRTLVCGGDANRFRRAVENNVDEFRPYFTRLRLGMEEREPRMYWGTRAAIAEVERLKNL